MKKDRIKRTTGDLKGTMILLRFILPLFIMTGFKERYNGQPGKGEVLYNRNCTRCHGLEGNKGWLGAHNLKKSVLGDSAIVQKIRAGKGFMPSFKKKLTPDECIEVMIYIKTLRTN